MTYIISLAQARACTCVSHKSMVTFDRRDVKMQAFIFSFALGFVTSCEKCLLEKWNLGYQLEIFSRLLDNWAEEKSWVKASR